MIDPRILQTAQAIARVEGVPLLGICGVQGCGKSTLARALAAHFGGVHLCLDDFYLGKTERSRLADKVHPLFATRGVPLTHDLDLAMATIAALRGAGADDQTPLPAFDKLTDERMVPADWPMFTGRPAVIVFEGWCLGATPVPADDLTAAINTLEAQQDRDCVWRRAWNAALAGPYQAFFSDYDAISHLVAPSFDVVLDWRCEQQEALLGLARGTLLADQRDAMGGFIQHFERLSRHMLAGGVVATKQINLDRERRVIGEA